MPSNRLDLSVVKPDFVPVSWYKVFGYPTGVGCLIARREALGRLRRPWFAGGSVYLASVQGDWHTLAPGEARFEDGTLSFLQIPDLEYRAVLGQRHRDRPDPSAGDVPDRLASRPARCPASRQRRADGTDLRARQYPRPRRHRRIQPAGSRRPVIDERAVARATAAAGISIRTGCFCNPGASEAASQLTRQDWRTAARAHARTMDQYLDLLGLPSGGALRASVGLASNVDDVERLVAFMETTYRDRVAGTGGLPPRQGC